MLSPRDEAVADAWYEAGIPLRTVTLGLQDGLEAAARRKPGSVRSLKFFSSFVQKAYQLRAERHFGDDSAHSNQGSPPRSEHDDVAVIALQEVVDADESYGPQLAPFISRLEACEADALWEELPQIDAQIAQAFFQMMNDDEVVELNRALDQHMAAFRHQGLSLDARTTEEGLFRDRYIRNHFKLPELVAIALNG